MSTAIAHPNIALIKYWGKKDEELILPVTSSLSVSLEAFETRTTVEVQVNAQSDTASINGKELEGNELQKVTKLLDVVRSSAGRSEKAAVVSVNTVPTAAGLASSASGFAALAIAAADAYGLKLSPRELSRLARKGSGSASRSLFGGFVLWNKGDDDESSYAEPIEWKGEALEMIIAVVSAERKHISSRTAMQKTAATSPYYQAWIDDNNSLVAKALKAVEHGDFTTLGELTELSTMRMHAVMLAASPPIRYLAPVSLRLFDAVTEIRANGQQVYATADAGPNVKMICKAEDTLQIIEKLQQQFPEIKFLRSAVGGPPKTI